MNQEAFIDRMDDILSSGSGIELSDWHEEELKELFDQFEDKVLLKQYANEYYHNSELTSLLEGELVCVAKLLGAKVKNTIVFEY